MKEHPSENLWRDVQNLNSNLEPLITFQGLKVQGSDMGIKDSTYEDSSLYERTL